MRQQYLSSAERIVDAMLAESPGLAQTAGDHTYDDCLPDWSPESVAQHVSILREAADALSQVDTDALPPVDAVDCTVLLARVERTLFELTEVREHEWNPLVHNPGALLHSLIERPFAPLAQRLSAMAGRLGAIPDALATARAVLADCPRIHLETAVGQFAGVAGMIRREVDRLLDAEPAMRAEVGPRQEAAITAIDEFGGFLRERLAGAEGRDPRLGRRLYEARLWHALDTDLTAAQIHSAASGNLARVSEEIRATAAAITGGPPTDDTVREALALAAADRPANDTIVAQAGSALTEATAFVEQFELMSLVDDVVEIREMPEFARGVAVAYCDSPGLLETASIPTYYCIAPTPTNWPPERVDSFYREYNNHMVRNLTVHEAMPGHFLQLAHARRADGSRKVRAVSRSGSFVEGWAVYAEEVMAEHGFGGRQIRLQQLKMQLRMTINALLDQAVHCDELTQDEALTLMRERGFQEDGEALGKWRRALLTSTQLSTYFVGYTEVAAIGRARPAGTGLREWHDRMLAHASPPPRHLRTLLGL